MDGASHRLCIRRAFSTPKTETSPNEDRSCISESGAIWAVSDGASVSYDSGPWAELVVRRFAGEPAVTVEWLNAAIVEYDLGYDREAMEWMQQAAFDRGSFATLLGAVSSPNSSVVRVFAVGDSILAVIDGTEIVRTIPYDEPEQFDAAPRLLSTSRFENRQFDEKTISEAWSDVDLSSLSDPILILMTDAIGRWLLDKPDAQRVAVLLEIADQQGFVEFVERERAEGRLRRDDSTLLVIGQSP